MLMVRDVQSSDRLQALPMYPRLTNRERRLLRATGVLLEEDAGRELVTEDHLHGHESFMVVAGEAVMTRRGEEVGRLGPGDSFGELGALGVRRQNATVTTSMPTVLLVLTPAELVRLMDEIPPFADQVYGIIPGPPTPAA